MSPSGPLDMIMSRGCGAAARLFSICSRHASHGSLVGVSRRWISIIGSESCSFKVAFGPADHVPAGLHARTGGVVKGELVRLHRSGFRETQTPQSARGPLGESGATMEYRNLGRSGVKVSPICLGTMMFGGPTDEATAARIVASARDAGINFIDTADQYTDGHSEEITGRAIKAKRDWWVLATKVANPTGEGPNGMGLSRQWIMRACDASLTRLGADFVDVYYLHKEDHGTPLAETVHAMADLMRAGKIRYFGVSNFRAWRVA